MDAEVAQFRDRYLSTLDFPYVFLDAMYCKARVNHRIVSQAIGVAVGVAVDGRREVLGFDVGDTQNEGFWTAFLRSLKARGLDGVKLVMSDAHSGLKKAIGTVFQGSSWQRCRVHFMRNVLYVVPKGSQDMVAPLIRTVFSQPDREHIEKQFTEVTTMLAAKAHHSRGRPPESDRATHEMRNASTGAERRAATRTMIDTYVPSPDERSTLTLDDLAEAPFNVAAIGPMMAEMMGGLDLLKTATTIAMPTLILAGDLDVRVPAEHMQHIAQTLPNAQYVCFPNVGHLIHAEIPDQWRRTVGAFYLPLE